MSGEPFVFAYKGERYTHDPGRTPPVPDFKLPIYKRWITSQDLPVREKRHCSWCNGPIPKGSGRRKWCGKECVKEFLLRSDGVFVKNALAERDNGRCAACKDPVWHWEADHIVEVRDGGGCCGLDNYQTLCVPCHKAKTRQRTKSGGALIEALIEYAEELHC